MQKIAARRNIVVALVGADSASVVQVLTSTALSSARDGVARRLQESIAALSGSIVELDMSDRSEESLHRAAAEHMKVLEPALMHLLSTELSEPKEGCTYALGTADNLCIPCGSNCHRVNGVIMHSCPGEGGGGGAAAIKPHEVTLSASGGEAKARIEVVCDFLI